MTRFLCQWIDRLAIHFAAVRLPRPDGRDCHLAEAQALLQNLDFRLDEVKPAAVQFDEGDRFHFASPRPSAHPVNNIVPGRFYPCGKNWARQPAVLLLHGWNDAMDHFYFFPRHARRLNRLGLNAASIQLPWQFDRRPAELGGWGNFLTADVLHTVEGTLQAMTEIRAMVEWLFAQGCPSVTLWGVSLGAWLAGLTICHDPRVNSAVLVVPVARLDHLIDEAKFCETIRGTLRDERVELQKMNLVSSVPVIDKKNILLVEAEHDVFVAKADVEELWRAWGSPEIWRCRSGHISILAVPGLAERAARWLVARAREPVAK